MPERTINLLTAVGTNSDLILQFADFFNGGPRYTYRPEAEKIRRSFGGAKIADLYLIITRDTKVLKVYNSLISILEKEYPEISIHPISLDCSDITDRETDTRARDLIYKKTAAIAGPDLVLSSAGRKQITQRLIEAGLLYGCAGYLAITVPPRLERQRNDIRRQTEQFHVVWAPAAEFYQEKRTRIIRDQLGDTFRSLYLLPAHIIKYLQNSHIGCDPRRTREEIDWLRKLPKTDLHCHLGGAYDFTLLRNLGQALLTDCKIEKRIQDQAAKDMENIIGTPLSRLSPESLRGLSPDAVHCLHGLGVLKERLKERYQAYVIHAVLVTRLSEAQLEKIALDGYDRAGRDLVWYMASGDLAGSGLLQTSGTLRLAVEWLIRMAAGDGVDYLEIRFSPGNYTRAGLDINRVIDLVTSHGAEVAEDCAITVRFLIMATRHKDSTEMKNHVRATLRAWDDHPGQNRMVVGFDLAGQEEDHPPEQFQAMFEPLHRKFVGITIHAGEMADDDKIWQAMYRLHAKRIGHGLKLIRNRPMMHYVRDWGVTIEMCPSSNQQTNSFRRWDIEDKGPSYPLKEYLDFGIRVTVNTDNPGISRTTASRELLTAARLTENGLSRWDILRLVRNGFKAAFLPRDQKDRLLKDADKKIFDLLIEEIA